MKRLALLVICLSFFQLTANAAVPPIEREALVAFYDSTDGANWWRKTNWLTGDPCADHWFGITCDENENISRIRLGNNWLRGSIPSELGNLDRLFSIDLRSNALENAIPPALGNLQNLHFLFLSDNKLTGPIPASLGNLVNLRDLALFKNALSGMIPAELGNLTNLVNLKIMLNRLEGPIPVELGQLTKLQTLWLNNNRLTGSIPSGFGNLTQLKNLALFRNQMSGSIPRELGHLVNLQWLLLSFNKLGGPIPPELGSVTSLYRLELDNNELVGTIPPELGELDMLRTLRLNHNQLTGTLPPELGNMDRLSELYLQHNQLSGAIPADLGRLMQLRKLVMNNNQLSGQIPAGLGEIFFLNHLVLNHNRLSGPIPADIGEIGGLSQLDLSGNALIGTVPSTFLNFRRLMDVPGCCLKLSWNALYTDNLELGAFLDDQNDGNWRANQTVAPKNVTVANVDPLSVTLAWEPIEYEADGGGYRVWVGTTAGGPYMNAGITADKTAESLMVPGPDPGDTFYYVVTTETDTHDDNLNTVISETSNEVFSQNVPSAWPAAIKATDGDFLRLVRVTFNPLEGATVYRVFRCVDAGPSCGSPIGYSKTGRYDDRNVIAGRTYYYRVRACVDNVCTGFSAADTGYASIQLAQPSDIRASSGLYSTHVDLDWSSVDGATGYRVFRCLDTGQTCGSPIGFPSSTDFKDTEGGPDIVFYYRVKACATQNCSRYSVARTGFRGQHE